jgi:hypothetical protein
LHKWPRATPAPVNHRERQNRTVLENIPALGPLNAFVRPGHYNSLMSICNDSTRSSEELSYTTHCPGLSGWSFITITARTTISSTGRRSSTCRGSGGRTDVEQPIRIDHALRRRDRENTSTHPRTTHARARLRRMMDKVKLRSAQCPARHPTPSSH